MQSEEWKNKGFLERPQIHQHVRDRVPEEGSERGAGRKLEEMVVANSPNLTKKISEAP